MTRSTHATRDELVVTPEEVATALLSGTCPAVQVRPPRHGLAAVLIPRGMARAEENQLRAALGVPTRPANRRKSA